MDFAALHAPRLQALLGCCVAVLLLLLLSPLAGDLRSFSITFWPLRLEDVAVFTITGRDGVLTSNLMVERFEQEAMVRYIRPGDVVLNIGGSYGTSCILFEKLARPKPGGKMAEPAESLKAHTFCVEPNPSIKSAMEKNFHDTGTDGIVILNSIIADAEHCPEGLPVLGTSERPASMVPPMRLPKTMTYGGQSFEPQACNTLHHLKSLTHDGKFPTVIFGDCEGCLPSIFEQFPTAFAAPEVRLVMYERDEASSAVYEKFEDDLQALGFRQLQCGWVSVWAKGPVDVTLSVLLWVLLMVPLALGWLLDRLARRLLSKRLLDTVPPVWRICVPFAIILSFPGDGEVLSGVPYPREYVQSSWFRCGAKGVVMMLYLFLAVARPACQRLMPASEQLAWLLTWASFTTAFTAGSILADLRGIGRKSREPQHTIWEASVAVVTALCITAVLRSPAARRHLEGHLESA